MVVPRSRFFPRRRVQPVPVSAGKRAVATIALVAGGMVTFIGLAILGFLWYRTMQIVSEHEKSLQPGAPAQPAATQNPPATNRPPPRGMPDGQNPRRDRQPDRSDEAK